MSRHLKLLVAALPFIAITLSVVRAETHLASSQTWLVDIDGYDPRDLLHGRYLQFTLRLPWSEGQRGGCGSDDACRVCLTRGEDGQVKRARPLHANAEQSCDGVLLSRYVRQAHRFYVSEDNARRLEARLRKAARDGVAQAELAIDADGRALVKALHLAGETVGR